MPIPFAMLVTGGEKWDASIWALIILSPVFWFSYLAMRKNQV